MEVRIINDLLERSIRLLFNLSLKGKQSRHRSKLIKQMNERLQEVAEQEQELIKEHANLDKDGNPKTNKEGTHWDIKDISAFAQDKNELYSEEMVIDGGDNQAMLLTVREVLDNCDESFSGEQAVLYEYLCEQFKVDEEITKKDDE